MLKKRLLVLIAVLMLVFPFMSITAQDKTIVDVAVGNKDFSTLVELVQAAGLVDVLKDKGPYTVFAPTNDAFAKLPKFAVDFLKDPAHKDMLTQVLTYHVVSGQVMAKDVKDMMAPSMQMAKPGDKMMGTELKIAVKDGKVTVNDANVVATDVEASNGVIHVIDTVLLPPAALPEITPATVTGDIAIDGSSTVAPLTIAIADKFKGDGYAGNVTVGVSGTGGGFKAFCEESKTDISNASRAIKVGKDGKEDETEKCIKNGREPIGFRVGTDGLAIAVSSQNDFASDITFDELKTIFSTAVKWSDVRKDWPVEDIVRYVPGTDSGTWDYFIEAVFATQADPVLKATKINQSEDDNVLVTGVESSKFAVGFFGYAYYQENASKLKVLAIDGVAPTFDSVEGGTYKLSRPLFIYSTAQIMAEKPQVDAFVNYYLANVQEVVGKVGYFPVSEFALNRQKTWYVIANAMGAMKK